MVLLLMSILTVQKGVLGTMITNLAANVKRQNYYYYIIYFQVFLKVLLSPVLICTGHIHHIFEVATNSLPMVPSKHLFVFCQNSALTQLTFSNFHLNKFSTIIQCKGGIIIKLLMKGGHAINQCHHASNQYSKSNEIRSPHFCLFNHLAMLKQFL